MSPAAAFLADLMSVAGHIAAIVLSVALALMAAMVGLDLASRARPVGDAPTARLWIAAASIAMGSGVWAMHFVGMSAMDYPFKAGFDIPPTVLSWAIAVGVCAVPLYASATQALRGPLARWNCGCATAFGIAAMHFVGVGAMPTSPDPTYAWGWIAAALLCASVGCSWGLSALADAHGPDRTVRRRQRRMAVLCFGSGLAGLHFLAQAAASFLPGTVCTTVRGVDAHALSGSVGAVTMAFLGLMALVSRLERRGQRIARELNLSLTRAHEEIKRATSNDAATGLPNRLVFQERIARAAVHADANGHSLALLLIEIDDFARATRACAPERIPDLLRACAERVGAAGGPACEVGSGGGSQFLVFVTMSGPADPTVPLRIAARLATGMRAPIPAGSATRFTASVGIALYPAEGGFARLTNNASVALEAAQARGGNGYAFFEPGMDSDAHAATEWLEALRFAADRDEFVLHYQPKVHARNLKIAGVEALIRWRHPEKGLVSPAIFIPLAERFGLINEIGDWVLAEATRQMGAWAAQGRRLRVAVNVSQSQLLQPDFVERIDGLLARHRVDPELLTCEITESGAMHNSESTMAVFKRLQALGVQLSIDDFGTGYSSLSHLRRIPLRQLKIDRSFVADLGTSTDARSIVAAIVVMAHELRLEVVAEGVETVEQRDILSSLGCDKFQGFLFARPMPAELLAGLLAEDADHGQRQFSESAFPVAHALTD